MAVYALACMPLAFTLGVWAQWRCGVWRASRAVVAGCHHPHWREPFEVRGVPGAFKQFCARCGDQRHCNPDGSPYVPGQD